MSENLRFSTTSFLLLEKKKSTHFLPSWKSLFKRGNFEIVLLVKCISARFWLVSKKVGILFLHHWSCLPEWCISHQIYALPFLIICPNMSSQSGQQTLGIYPSNSLIFEKNMILLTTYFKIKLPKASWFWKSPCSIWDWPAYFFFKSNNTLPNRKITVTARSDYDDPWHLHFISEMQQLSWKKWPVKHHHSIHSRWQLFTFAHCQEHKLQRLTIKTSGHDFFLPFVFFLSLSPLQCLSLFRKMDFRQNHYGQIGL